jgi:hypothetical protein
MMGDAQADAGHTVAALSARVDQLQVALSRVDAQLDELRSTLGSETVDSALQSVIAARQQCEEGQRQIVKEVCLGEV